VQKSGRCASFTAIGKISGYIFFGPGKLDLIDPVINLVEMITDFRIRVHIYCDSRTKKSAEIMKKYERERKKEKRLFCLSEICKCG